MKFFYLTEKWNMRRRQPGNFWLCPVKPEMQFTKNFRKSSKLDERMINAQGQVGGQSVGRWKKKEVSVFDNNNKILWAVGCDDDVMMLTPNCKTMIIIITITKRSYGLGEWKETNPSGPSFPLIHSSLRHSTFLQSFEEEKSRNGDTRGPVELIVWAKQVTRVRYLSSYLEWVSHQDFKYMPTRRRLYANTAEVICQHGRGYMP